MGDRAVAKSLNIQNTKEERERERGPGDLPYKRGCENTVAISVKWEALRQWTLRLL